MRTPDLVRRIFDASSTVPQTPEPKPATTPTRVVWRELAALPKFAGMWVALDRCRYDSVTRELLEGDLVDWDVEAGELCARLRAARRGSCAIRCCAGNDSVS